MGSFLAAKGCWSVSVLFFAHCQKIFCFGLCAFKGRTEILAKALFMSVFNCWLTTLFLHAGGSCWIIALAGRSRQWNWIPPPQSQITANLKGLLLKDYWVSESQARKKNGFFFPVLSLCLSLRSPALTSELRVVISTILISMPSNKEVVSFC